MTVSESRLPSGWFQRVNLKGACKNYVSKNKKEALETDFPWFGKRDRTVYLQSLQMMLLSLILSSQYVLLSEIITHSVFCVPARERTPRAGAVSVLSAQCLTWERGSVNSY